MFQSPSKKTRRLDLEPDEQELGKEQSLEKEQCQEQEAGMEEQEQGKEQEQQVIPTAPDPIPSTCDMDITVTNKVIS